MLYPISKSWENFELLILEKIQEKSVSHVLEIGGGANPFLSKDQIFNNDILYTIIDRDQEELDKTSGQHFKKICLDLNESAYNEKYDLVFSKMVLEHIPNPTQFHINIQSLCHSETTIIHFYATKYGLPSLLNLMLPSKITDLVVYNLQKRDPHQEGKFKAYYKMCFGPVKKSTTFFESISYHILQYDGFVGHGYLSRFRLLGKLERWFSNVILKLKAPSLCSNAIIVLKLKQ